MRNPVMKRQNYIATTAIAAMLAVMFVGAILPTPLYPLFREAFGFSPVTLTLIYAVYVLGNLVALLLFGRLADQIGQHVDREAAGEERCSGAAMQSCGGKYFKRPALLGAEVTFFRQLRRRDRHRVFPR